MENYALIVIDVQKDISRYKKIKYQEIIPTLNGLIELFRNHNLPIIHLQHVYTSFADVPKYLRESYQKNPTLIEGTDGASFVSGLDVSKDDIIIKKPGMDGFFGSNFDSVLRNLNIETLFITGGMTHLCVRSTALSALERNYNVFVVSDATKTINERIQKNNIDDLRIMGAEIVNSTDLRESFRFLS